MDPPIKLRLGLRVAMTKRRKGAARSASPRRTTAAASREHRKLDQRLCAIASQAQQSATSDVVLHRYTFTEYPVAPIAGSSDSTCC